MTATDVSRGQAPQHKPHFDEVIEGEEVQQVEGELQQVEEGDDHPELEPGEVVLRVGGAEGHQGEPGGQQQQHQDPGTALQQLHPQHCHCHFTFLPSEHCSLLVAVGL